MNTRVVVRAVATFSAAAIGQIALASGGASQVSIPGPGTNGIPGPPPAGQSPAVFTSTILVTEDFEIADLSVTLVDLAHGFAEAVQLTLTNGTTTIDLVNRIGIGPNGVVEFTSFFPHVTNEFTFANSGADIWQAAANAPSGIVPSGVYAASSALSGEATNAFSTFFGTQSAGEWTLTLIQDRYGRGRLGSWAINFTPVPAPMGAGLLGLGGLVAARRRRG